MFKKLKDLIKGKKGKFRGNGDKIVWVDSSENPWNAPILDLRPFTLSVLSTTLDRQNAENAMSYTEDYGFSFLEKKPENDRVINTDIKFPIDETLSDGVLFLPTEMEHKWAIYFLDGKIIFVRSWLRKVRVYAETEQDGQFLRIKSICGTFTDELEEPELTINILKFLLKSHSLDILLPAPLPEGFEKDPKVAGFWCFQCFGNKAYFATPYPFDEKPIEKPLRTHSLLHIAVAKKDIEKATKFLDKVTSINLLAGDGLAPMHWPLACDDLKMMEFLLKNGADVDVRSFEGATPLMNAVQARSLEKTSYLLEKGADPNAKDDNGFTALHRAAEMGELELTKLLVKEGALKNVEAQGHTPASLAEMRGEKKVLKILKN